MKKIIFILFLSLLVFGCASKKKLLKMEQAEERTIKKVREYISRDVEVAELKRSKKPFLSAKKVSRSNPKNYNSFKNAFQEGKDFNTYRVGTWTKDRDCLWNISKKVYNSEWVWREIYKANKHQIKDPNLIYPGQILVIPKKRS